MDHFYALIMAGGGGTRLWPLSRKTRPKQALPLTEDRSMFQISVERLAPLLPPERVFVVTGQGYAEQLHASTPAVPRENFVIEPFGRDSGPAAALGIVHIRQRDPEAVIAILAADHHIADVPRFLRVLSAAHDLAGQGYITTLGISPSFPSTGYGYIERGEPLGQVGEFPAYVAEQFTEKPDAQTAVEFLASGRYSWNSGMFISRADTVLAEFARQQPVLHAQLEEIGAAVGRQDYRAVLDRVWPQIERISLDYAVMEDARKMALIPVDMGWSDIGSWTTLFDVLDGDTNGNVARGQSEKHVLIDTSNTLIVGDRMVVTIGVDDLVIVDTPDVVLVCHRARSEDVRTVVNRLKEKGDEAHL